MVHDDDTGQRPWDEIPDDDRPLRGRRVDPEIVRAIRGVLVRNPNYSDQPHAIFEVLRADFPRLSLGDVHAALRALSGPEEPSPL
jgi:hypothetical protein